MENLKNLTLKENEENENEKNEIEEEENINTEDIFSSQIYEEKTFYLQILSFGHKFGCYSKDLTDLMYDVRRLPIPGSVRLKTGLDKDLQKAFYSLPKVQTILNETMIPEIQFLITQRTKNFLSLCQRDKEEKENQEDHEAKIANEGKKYENLIVVAIGCHAGQHRSVALVEKLAKYPWTVPDSICFKVYHFHRDIFNSLGKNNSKRKDESERKKRRDEKSLISII